jgi:hypothetical protein
MANTMFHHFVGALDELGYLAEVEAELGEIDAAIARLYPLAISSDDSEYVGQLARVSAMLMYRRISALAPACVGTL